MSRGGMSSNPFAGNPSMNMLDDDFMASLFKGEISVDQALALRIIKMSVRDYMYFGLGRNGITPEKFLEAFYYLFKVRSTDPTTWGDCSTVRRFRNAAGIVQIIEGTLRPEEVVSRCFDSHYDITRLGNNLHYRKFLELLKAKRTSILNANKKQVLTYMDKYRAQEWRQLGWRKGKHDLPRVNPIPLLVSPENVKDFASLYLFGRSPEPVQELVATTKTLSYRKLLF